MATKFSAEWLSYHLNVLPSNAPPNQVTETRRAFYAGAHALMGKIKAIGDRADTDALNEADADELEAIDRELIAFSEDVGKGRA